MAFEYIDAKLKFDHKVCFAKYNFSLVKQREFFPKERFHKTWVLPKFLEFDAEFLESIKYVFESTEEEIMQ